MENEVQVDMSYRKWFRGETLPNGATVLESRDNCVLALWARSVHRQYAIWDIDKRGGTMNGRYFEGIREALKEFDK